MRTRLTPPHEDLREFVVLKYKFPAEVSFRFNTVVKMMISADRNIFFQAFEKSALKPIYLPDTSATEKGVEAAEAVARFLNAKDGSRDSSSDDVVNVERIHTSDKSVSQARPEASVQHAKPKSKNLMDISKVDDSEAKDYVRLFPIYEPKPSDSEAAAAAAAAAAELQESAAELPLPQDTPTRPIIYRSASWPAPPPPQPIKRYRAASPAIETDSDANAASDDGAEMVEVPIPLQDLSPPSNAVARSFPTPFSAYDFGRTEPEVEAEPGARFQPSKEDSETTEDSADSNSYQVKVRLPARPLTYGRWANNRVGSINVNFAADDEKVGEGEKNIVEEGPPAPDSEADDKKEQVEQTEDEKEGETDTEEVRKVEEEERKEEEEVQAAEQAEANAKVREEEEEQEEENSVQAVDDHAAPAAAAVQLPSDSFEEPAAAALWSYRGSATGPTRWGELGYPACGSGEAQSPINIEFNVEPASLPPIAWRVPEDSDASQSDGRAVSAARVFYNGRAVVVAGLDAVLAVGGGEEYALRAIHVHTPSEHAVGGLHYDMELHFVHSAVVEGQIRSESGPQRRNTKMPWSFL